MISDSDRRVPADWGQESQASSWVEAWNSACLSRCPRGERPLVELYLEPGVFSERCTEKLPLRVDAFTGWSSERCPGIGFLSRGDREIGVLRIVEAPTRPRLECRDRKSTRLNSSHHSISYAVFCLK